MKHARIARYITSILGLGLAYSTEAAPVALNWNGWSLSYDVSGFSDGVSLRNVSFQGKRILGKASFPVMRVFYDNNDCGPYADRIGESKLVPVSWAQDARIVAREFTQNGQQWYEIGVEANIGNYDMYQVWYLNTDGILDGHIFSKGLNCNTNHIHYPYWRLDIDVAGGGGDQLRYMDGGQWRVQANEFNSSATTATNHQWQVRDTVTGDTVDIQPSGSGWNVPGPTVPRSDYENNVVLGRLYRISEDTSWEFGAGSEVPFDNAESIDNADVVFWYKGYLPHTAAEGPVLWHSTGVRLSVGSDAASGGNRPPVITNPGPQSSTIGTDVSLATVASDPDGDTLSYNATGLPPGLSINTSTGQISGRVPANNVGSYSTTVAVSDGRSSVTASFVWTVTSTTSSVQPIRYSFENGLQDWRLNGSGNDTATSGRWEAAAPGETVLGGATIQSGSCNEGRNCLVTDRRRGTRVGSFDVDGGRTSIRSPNIDLRTARSATLSFAYYFAHAANSSRSDYFRVRVIGRRNSVIFEELGGAVVDPAVWQTKTVDLSSFVGQTITLQFDAADMGTPSLVEAAVDSVVVESN